MRKTGGHHLRRLNLTGPSPPEAQSPFTPTPPKTAGSRASKRAGFYHGRRAICRPLKGIHQALERFALFSILTARRRSENALKFRLSRVLCVLSGRRPSV